MTLFSTSFVKTRKYVWKQYLESTSQLSEYKGHIITSSLYHPLDTFSLFWIYHKHIKVDILLSFLTWAPSCTWGCEWGRRSVRPGRWPEWRGGEGVDRCWDRELGGHHSGSRIYTCSWCTAVSPQKGKETLLWFSLDRKLKTRFWKYIYLLHCRVWNEKIDTTLMSVFQIWSAGKLAAGKLEPALGFRDAAR